MTELIIRYAEPSGIADRTVIPSEVVGTLVRCKDCEHYDYEGACSDGWGWCAEHDGDWRINDFCSWAKMKGGAE